jgi:hypothetical protein
MEAAYLKVYGRRDSLIQLSRTLRIGMNPFPVIFASVSLRRINQKTGIAEDVHAHDHVVAHILAIRDRHGDIKLPARDHDAGVDDVSFFRLERRGCPNADSVEHGPEAGTRREVRVKAGPCRAGVDLRKYAKIPFAAAEGDLFDNADRRPLRSLPPL